MGGTTQLARNQPATIAVKALDPDSGAVRWSTKLDQNDFDHNSTIGGLVLTDGGIVVTGCSDRLSVLDSDSGKYFGPSDLGGYQRGCDDLCCG